MKGSVAIYDTTLRDGAQSEGISFSIEDKQEILDNLDSFGMTFVEGGWPGSNPKDDEFFAVAKTKHTKLTAFGSTRRHGVKAEDDKNLKALAECKAEWCCIFGKTWDFQVTDALRITLEENLDMIRDSVAFLKSRGKHVMFDAEHFFDGYASNPDYALECLKAAEEGGAEWAVLCDTNGGSLPSFVGTVTAKAVSILSIQVGIHCHNDSDLATANSLVAVENGATMVQGTINGIGERCGNADLCSVIPDLALKMDMDTGIPNLSILTDLSRTIAEIANMTPQPGLPFVGEKAFAHKGGMHVSALAKDTRMYEHISPDSVGNRRRVLVSDMAGRASILEKVKGMGLTVSEKEAGELVDRIKSLEAEGYQFEGADASFELLVRRLNGGEAPFSVKGFRLFIDDVGNNILTSEASIKVADSLGNEEHTAADGEGPVNALDNAMRKALSKLFPIMDKVRLTDYKVRVLDEKSATAARVRVLIRSTDGKDSWTTMGVSENVIEASLHAMIDSVEYAILKDRNRKERQ